MQWRPLLQQFPAMDSQRTAILSGQEGHQRASYSAAETSLTRAVDATNTFTDVSIFLHSYYATLKKSRSFKFHR